MIQTLTDKELKKVNQQFFDCVIINTKFKIGDLNDLSLINSHTNIITQTNKLIEESTKYLKDGGLIYIYGLPKFLSFYAEFLNKSIIDEYHFLFKYWISLEFDAKLMSQPLPNSHLGLLMYLKTSSIKNPTPFHLNTKTVRIPYQACPACLKHNKDWGGKKHLMNPLGTAISDVWSDLGLNFEECEAIPNQIIDRIYQLQSEDKNKVLLIKQSEFYVEDSIHIESQKPNCNPNKIDLNFEFKNKVVQNDCIAFMQAVKEEYPEGIFDLAFADPPYNLEKNYSTYSDNQDEQAYIDWCNQWLNGMYECLKPGGSLFVLNIPKWAIYHCNFLADKMHFRHWIVWDALSTPSGKFLPAHYALLYFTKPMNSEEEIKPNNILIDNRAYCLRGTCLKSRKQKNHDKKEVVSDIWKDIHRIKHKKDRDNHPCQLPHKLMERIIQHFSKEGDWIFDPFGGAGTTAIVAKINNRQFTITDLDDHYFAIATRNLNNLQIDAFGNLSYLRPPVKVRKNKIGIKKEVEITYLDLCRVYNRLLEEQELIESYPELFKKIQQYKSGFKNLQKISRRSLENADLLSSKIIQTTS